MKAYVYYILGIFCLLLGIILYLNPLLLKNIFAIDNELFNYTKSLWIELLFIGVLCIFWPYSKKLFHKNKHLLPFQIPKLDSLEKARIINTIIWVWLFIDSLFLMYENYFMKEYHIVSNGELQSKLLLIPALALLIIYYFLNNYLFRKDRINKLFLSNSRRLIISLYIITILGLSFAQACIIWSELSFDITGKRFYLSILYIISVLLLFISFPWKWKINPY